MKYLKTFENIKNKWKDDLYTAIESNNYDDVEDLIEKGVNVNCEYEDEDSPLYEAINSRKKWKIVKLLIDSGANINYINESEGNTPLILSAYDVVDYTLMKLLIKKGANLYHKNNDGLDFYDNLMRTYAESEYKYENIKGKENKILIQTTESLNAYYDRTYKSLLTANPFGAIAAGVLACAGFVVSYLIDPFLFASLIVYVLLVLLACVVIATGMFNRWYTPEGRAIVDHIEGFKMYLETAESERMKIIGTPPDRTPELYETFLPYAMALDVEKAWTKQFEPVFEAYERMHHTPYYPLWFIGTDLSGFSSGGFASSFVSSIGSSTISSSSFAPGSSSGFGSGGSSGGGGGGGGGGGW